VHAKPLDRRSCSSMPYRMACSMESLRTVLFVQNVDGTSINACCTVGPLQGGVTAVMIAASFGHLDVVKELLARGASVDRASTDVRLHSLAC